MCHYDVINSIFMLLFGIVTFSVICRITRMSKMSGFIVVRATKGVSFSTLMSTVTYLT